MVESIGVFKPYKFVSFGSQNNDLSSVMYEVCNVAYIFSERGHHVSMLSDTDISKHNIPNITSGSLDQKYDRIIVYSGSFSKDPLGHDIIPKLRKQTTRLSFLLTDLRLLPDDRSQLELFDDFFTQATRPLECLPKNKPQQYAAVAEFYCYHLQFKNLEEIMKNKNTRYAFFGTERGRLTDVAEYCWRPECQWIGKSKTFNFDTRVPRDDFKKALDDIKFSITIADEAYNQAHFITPRPYEHYQSDIVNFVDDKFDPDEHLEKKDSWMRVQNYLELRKKMEEIDEDDVLWKNILLEQRTRIKPEYLDGSCVYDRLQ